MTPGCGPDSLHPGCGTRPCLARSFVHLSPAPGAPRKPGQPPCMRGSSPRVLLQPSPGRPKTPLTLLLALAHATALGRGGSTDLRKSDLRKILIIYQLPAGRRGEGLPVRKQPRSARGGVYGQLRRAGSPDGFQQPGSCRRAPSCPLPPRSSLPEGLPACREQPYFQHLAVALC